MRSFEYSVFIAQKTVYDDLRFTTGENRYIVVKTASTLSATQVDYGL